MKLISQKKFKDVIATLVLEAKDDIYKFVAAGTFFTIVKHKGYWLQNLSNMSYAKLSFLELHELASIVKWKGRLGILEGFYDKSLNTAMYKDVQKCKFLWNDMEFTFEEIEKISVLINTKTIIK